MSQLGEVFDLGLQEREARTIVEILRERMDGVDRVGRWETLKQRLGLKGMGCCGASWDSTPSTMTVRDDDDDEGPPQQQQQIEVVDAGRTPPENASDPGCVAHIPAARGMNLAAALAVERNFRAANDSDGGDVLSPSPVGTNNNGPSDVGTAPGKLLRVSLMRLLEESDGGDGEREKGGVGCDPVCCVCMGRKKGAAFIPCGHTFCRVCSRELWLNRGSCPLCNRLILEILDIF